MKSQRLATFCIVLLTMYLYSCNNQPSSAEGSFANGPASNGPASNSNIHMMDQQATDEGSFPDLVNSENLSENPANIPESINLNIFSEDKGVGKFNNLKLTGLNKNMASEGDVLFHANCAACHSITADRLVGPGLKGITAIRTPEWIMNMVTNPAGMTSNDSIAKALLQVYSVQMAVSVTNDQARKILEYLRNNDELK
jgi:hypothetical protein